MIILKLENVDKNFSGLQALDRVNLEVMSGECHAIIGPNGSGKSTLFNVITGFYKPSGGKIFFKDRDITGWPAHKIARLGCARSFQITQIFPMMTIFENVRNVITSRFNCRFNCFRLLNGSSNISKETNRIIELLHLDEVRDLPASVVDYGSQRKLEVALALAWNPDLIMLDEPTAGLDAEDTRGFVQLIGEVTQGKTLIMVEHDMEVVFKLADRITVLDYGQILATGTVSEIKDNEEVKKAYLESKNMLLEVLDIHTFYEKSHVLHGVSLKVDAKETVSILGRNGVGKSTTLKSIIGLVPPKEGSIKFRDRAISGWRPYKICRLGIGYVPEERRVFRNITVRQNLLVGLKPNQKADNPWTIDRVYEHFPKLQERDGVKAGNLSGGEQQMLTVGRTLMGNPDLLLIDEPTEGLAPRLREEIVEIMYRVKESGCAVILVEQNMEVALDLADRVYVMAKGDMVFEGTSQELRAAGEIRKKYLEV